MEKLLKKKRFKAKILKFYFHLTNLLPNKSNVFMYNTGFKFLNEKKLIYYLVNYQEFIKLNQNSSIQNLIKI